MMVTLTYKRADIKDTIVFKSPEALMHWLIAQTSTAHITVLDIKENTILFNRYF